MVLLVLASFLLGASLTSFFNLYIYRRDRGLDFVWTRSSCEACGQVLEAWSLVPVLGFFLARGRATCCQAPISWAHPLSEFIGGLIALVVIFTSSYPLVDLAYFMGLYLLALEDARSMAIRFEDLLACLALVIVLSLFFGPGLPRLGPPLLAFVLFYLPHRLFPQAMGEGDAWAGLYLGLFASSPYQALLLFTGTFVLGGLYSLVLMALARAGPKTQVPLVPFMLASALVFFII